MMRWGGIFDEIGDMSWAFRIIAALNGLLLAVLFFYRASGEDAAGRGMREGAALLYLMALAVTLLAYWLIKWWPLRILILVVMSVPLLLTIYALLLMIQ